MTSQAIMIEEASKARESLHGELSRAMEAGRPADEWFMDRWNALQYYTRLLQSLGALAQA